MSQIILDVLRLCYELVCQEESQLSNMSDSLFLYSKSYEKLRLKPTSFIAWQGQKQLIV